MSANFRPLTKKDYIGFFGMIVGMFMAILDIQIVSSSIAEIQAGLAATTDEISWVQTSYLIAEVIVIPLTGILSRALSTRTLFLISAIGFTASSFLCSLAWDINSMIIFRAIQGFLGGAMIPTVFATCFLIFPPAAQAKVTVIIGLVVTIAPTLGPTIGGYVTEALSWHWMFLLNVGPGIFVVLTTWYFVDFDEADYSIFKTFDYTGAIILALSLGSMQYILEEGNKVGWFEDELILGISIFSIASLGMFVVRTLTIEHPVLNFRAFKDRNFLIGSIYSFILGIGLYGTVYLLPLYLAIIRGLNSLEIGLVMFVGGLARMFSAPIAGFLFSKLPDSRPMMMLGILLFCAGLYSNTFLTHDSDFHELLIPQILQGLSLMICFIPINNIALGTLPKHEIKNSSGLYNLTRNLGGAIGLAALNTYLTNQTKIHYAYLSENINHAKFAFGQFFQGISGKLSTVSPNSDQMAYKIISNITHREAYVNAFNDSFHFISITFLISLPLIFFVKPVAAPKKSDNIEHAH